MAALWRWCRRRANTGTTSPMMPRAGTANTYTVGCQNIQAMRS